MYMNALDRARIHTPELRRTAFWIFLVSAALASADSADSCAAGFFVSSPESSSMDGSPLLSGVSCSQNKIRSTPRRPAQAAPKKPHFQPKAATMEPTNMNERPSPMLCEALKNP